MDRLSIPGARSLAATFDGDEPGDCAGIVVACPPHPQLGGDRHDSRLRAVSDALVDRGFGCLRFDYGPWDGGRAEQDDVQRALAWARERSEWVGLFGFSFGASMALLAAREAPAPAALSAMAPDGGGSLSLDVPGALASIECPTQILYGERDDTADWVPVVERARELGLRLDSLPADHFFVGQREKAADRVVSFLLEHR